ncbi:hypothetical protein Ple7327_2622 [Pleurocapsa sp. PCC 7327]|uniref:hypothetical protein n=1 Tax=Pleurocapsa sp. PCC 7327 TaxID=118163 RepID=UPI00029FD34D|nr:hypothetical protein [Pleurocapsa sp. PCC 7327]AFY77905.1 hypothetical protein Ple7327_2622 [Pleurocapsa sp. PCC 7327]
MPLPSDLLNETVRQLENHEESLRIKKVIFCLCKKYWENTLDILNTFSLSDLIEELISAYPTLDRFKEALVKLVKTLNRPNIYTEVAKVIFARISKLYKSLEEEPQTAIIASSTSSEILNLVASKLRNHQEQARIKKVIYSVCRKRWENDIQIIDSYSLSSLIRELMQHYPTKDELQRALIKLVQNINKQNLYLAIANIIVNQLGGLYNNKQNLNTLKEETGTQIVNTQFVQINNFNSISNPVEPQQPIPQNFGTSVIDLSVEQASEVQPQSERSQQPQKTLNLFELRLEIMQYTNPLRAKVLLFSVLYQSWDKNNQDWAMLRSYTLDDLLKELIQSAKSLTDMESKLFAAARILTDFEANMQTANTIIEAIKPHLTNN